MKEKINLKKFQPAFGKVKELDESKVVMEINKEEIGRYEVAGKPGEVGGFIWKEEGYIVADVTCFQDWSLVFMFEFWEEDNHSDEPNITIRMSLLPNIKTRLALPMKALDSQEIFLPRTPGKLRSFVHGKKVDVKRINRFALSVREGYKKQTLEISDVYFTDAEPDYPLPDVKLVDELGQLSIKDWPGKIGNMDEMKSYLRQRLADAESVSYPESWSSYGGWKGKKLEAKGYFSLQNDGRRWWLVDPDGYVFFTSGMDAVITGDNGPVKSIEKFYTWVPSENGEFKDAWNEEDRWRNHVDTKHFSFAKANLIRTFGDDWKYAWAKITKANLVSWGINTIGAFSCPEFVAKSKMPYLMLLEKFPETEKKVFRDFPDVFSEEYKENSKKYARQMLPYVMDKNLIGYFLRNEPEWAFTQDLEIAEELLDTDEDLVTKEYLITFLSERYHSDIDKLNQAWKTNFESFEGLRKRIRKAGSLSESAKEDLNDFSGIMIKEYVKVPSLAVREVDPHHLNLGMRYAFILYENQLAGKEYFDIFSINCYKINPSEVIRKTVELAKMPVMIGEFHFGALDRGIQATGIVGVESQKDRGKAYRCYVENAASIPECVGVQYYQYNDQAAMGRPDGENYQIGFIDVCNKPHQEFINEVIKSHRRMYEVASGQIQAAEADPKRITSNIAS